MAAISADSNFTVFNHDKINIKLVFKFVFADFLTSRIVPLKGAMMSNLRAVGPSTAR